MSSILGTRLFMALALSAVAVAGCSGSISTEGIGEDGDEEAAIPGDPSDPSANFAGEDGLSDVMGICGNGSCEPGESCANCSLDCGPCPACGDGMCSPNEDCSSCAADCGACACSHDLCANGPALVAGCDPCVDQICAVDSFCCDVMWDGLCVNEVASVCGQQCPVTCGNAICEAGETCGTCSQDCGACPVCGDSLCDWSESCSSCAQDCGACPVCGDGTCDWGESCSSCSQDCGACVCHDVCVTGTALDASCGQCEAQICAVDSFCCQAAWDSICVSEVASVCGQQCPVACGNGICEAGETCGTCSQDCGACPVCGDNLCDWSESCSSCAQDCGACPVCGDGTCDWSESCSSCSQDCGACVCHDVCVTGTALDASCGQCEAQICAVDPFCCQAAWDSLCVSEVASVCGQQCPVACGNGICEAGETCGTCSQDCGACPVCGDNLCDWSESCSSCAQDCGACPVCGDNICDWSESCSSCSQDCGACPVCGDGTCDWGESCSSCSQDCGACVCHDPCESGTALDASCGPCEAQICAVDSFCCNAAWDGLCVSEVTSVCGQQCP